MLMAEGAKLRRDKRGYCDDRHVFEDNPSCDDDRNDKVRDQHDNE